MSNEDIPDGYTEGTVEDAVVSNRDTERVTVVDDANECFYWFEIRELSWGEVQDLVADNLTMVDGEPTMDATGYSRDALEAMITDSNIDQIATFLSGMRQEIGSQLEAHVPDPLDDEEIQEQLGN